MIIDTFPFFNELELLEIRLAELKDVVDLFVLVEATHTHSGKSKPLYFDENKERFAEFNIEHVIVRSDLNDMQSSWQREHYPRRVIKERLLKMNLCGSDIVMLSDIDEIPRVATVIDCLTKLPNEPAGTVYVFQQWFFYYYVNCRAPGDWPGTRMARWSDIGDMQELRLCDGKVIENAGWHFSYIGGAERIRYKIQSYAHRELDDPRFTDINAINRHIEEDDDLFGRGRNYTCVPLDDSFPAFLLSNTTRFQNLIKPYSADMAAKSIFKQAVSNSSDLSEHLWFLYRIASLVNHITDLQSGGRGNSSSAFIYAKPRRLITYDLAPACNIELLEKAATGVGVEVLFFKQDVLTINIEPTDLLFIDTWHVEEQMREELARHADKVRKYIVMHDTETFGEIGETPGHRGIWPAVSAFIRSNPEWELLQHFSNNNGLTVLARRA